MRQPLYKRPPERRDMTFLEMVITYAVLAIVIVLFAQQPHRIDPGLRAAQSASHAIVRNECPVGGARLNSYEHELQNRYCEVVASRD